MLREASQAWDRFQSSEIMMSTVTLCMSIDLAETVKKEIRDFKSKLFEIIAKERKKPERVFHLNLNFFPMTKKIERQ